MLSEFNFGIDRLKSKLLGFPLWPKKQNSVMYYLQICIKRLKLCLDWAALQKYIFQIRSHWSLTWEVIRRWTESAISSFSPVSQSTVGNSDSQLGVFTMWQAQRHFWSCQHRGLSNLLRNQMQQIKYLPQLSIWGLCLPAERRGWVAQRWGWGEQTKSHMLSHYSRKTVLESISHFWKDCIKWNWIIFTALLYERSDYIVTLDTIVLLIIK